MSKPSVHSILDLVPHEAPDWAKAWDALQVHLIQLAEQDERGGADILALHRVVADYDHLRSISGYRDV